MSKVARQSVDRSAYPDLVLIYLGMRVNAWRGLKTLLGFGPVRLGACPHYHPGGRSCGYRGSGATKTVGALPRIPALRFAPAGMTRK